MFFFFFFSIFPSLYHSKQIVLNHLFLISGFVSVSEEGNHFSAERSIKQVLYKLNHLKTVWEDILPPHIYSKAMGTHLLIHSFSFFTSPNRMHLLVFFVCAHASIVSVWIGLFIHGLLLLSRISIAS